MAKQAPVKPKEPVESKPVDNSDKAVDNRYKGNDFVSADNQRTYAELMTEMKLRPELNKLMLAPEWEKINAILSFLILKQLERKG
jgi:hypothetical protein